MAPYTGFSKGRSISPEASQLLDALEAEALEQADPSVPIAPVQLPPAPLFSAVVGFDMAALLVLYKTLITTHHLLAKVLILALLFKFFFDFFPVLRPHT